MASYTALMNIQVDSQQAQLGINNLNKNLIYLSRSSRLTNKSLLQMQQTFLRIENTINQATGNTASFNAKMQQAMNVIKKLRGEVSSLRSQINSLNNATGSAGTSATKATTAFQRFTKTLQQNQYFTSLAVSALAGFVSQRLVGGIIRITDEYTLMENKIKTVTPTVDGVATSMAAVKAIAQDTRQPLSIIANMFSRIGRNSKELQGDLTGLIDVTSTVSKAFQIGGATIEESRNAMVQFSQALASGRLQGDELRSILELAPELAKAISKSIGITTGSLRKLASEGLITTEVLIKSLLEAGKEVRETFDNFVPTVEQSAETVVTSFTAMIGGNEKFKQANEVLGNQLRTFASALDEQGSIANMLGEAYLTLARNVDVLAAAFVGIGAAIAGAGLVGFFMLLASAPVATGLAALTALIAGISFYKSATEGAKEAQNELVQSTDELLKKLKESGDTLGEDELAKMQTDIITKQSQFRTLISETKDEIKQLNEDLKETEQYNAIEKLLAKTNPDGETFLGNAPLYMDEDVLREQKRIAEEELKFLEDQAQGLEEGYDKITDAIKGGAMQAMLARTQALEAQKRLLQQQASAEQMDYLGSFGAGMSDTGLGNIKFANQAAQELRKSISDITMKLTDRAFMGPLSVNTLFGNTDPSTAVSNLTYLVQKFKEETAGDPKETGGKVASFFDRLMGIEKSGDTAAIKALNEIKDQLTKEPFKAELLRENMITVWESALEKYQVYAAEVQAQENRFIALKKRDLQFEAKEQQALFNAEKRHLDDLFDESATIHDANVRAVTKQTNLRYAQILIELESKEISAERAKELTSELGTLHKINTALAEQALRAKAVNQILQNREEIRVGQSTQNVTAETGGFEEYGGSQSYNMIGSALRDIDIQYKVQLATIEAIYGVSSKESIELRTQEGILKNINREKKISELSDSVRLDTAREMASNEVLGREIELQEQGLNASDIKIKLLEEESQLALDSLQFLGEEGDELRRNLGLMYDQRIEAEKLNNIREALKATKNERAIGNAVIDGISALISGDFYKSIWNSLSSGATNLVQSIQNINWGTFGEDFANKIKNIDWKGIALDFGELFKSASGLLEAAATVGGQSGQRALNIGKAAQQGYIAGSAFGGPAGGLIGGTVTALGAAIMSNEKFQQALSRLFDALFKLIDPFLDLLGPVIDIFTAFLENNPIMTAVNALKPLLEGLSNAIGALAAVIKNLDLSGDNIFTNIPVIGPALKYMAGGDMAKDIEDAFDKTFLSGFGGRGGILEVRIPALEDIMGKFYTDFAASGVMTGKKDFRTIYNETTKAFEGATKTYTEEVPDTYINYQYLTGNLVEGFKSVTKQVALTWKTVERTVPLTSAEIKAKAEEAVRKTFEKILEGIDEETKSIISETEKLNQESQSPLAAGLETIKGVRAVMQELEYGLTFLSSEKAEEARKQMEAFSKAQEEYFEALVGSEIRSATEDLEESILSFQRMATAPMDQITRGLDSFTNQVTEFQNAIDEVSDPAKKAALQENLTAFKSAFEAVSAATAYQMVQDIELRGYDLTKEQELAIKYEKEIMDVRAREDLSAERKVMIINRLIAAREREVEAMEREQELLNLQGAQNTLQEILSTFEKTIEGINDLITSLYDQVQDLLFGEFNLDPYLQKFELASETYGTLLEAAFDPDATEDDIKQLQEFVNTYLGTARDLYKSSSTFQQIFSNVLSDLSLLGVQAGFNMPQTAVSGATSEIQDFIDATEDLTEELSGTLNNLIFELNGLGLAFANQKLDIIQDELGIPLKITNDIITVDLSSVSLPLELNNDNFSLSTTKLNFAEAFGEITFDPDFGQITDNSGWQQYEKTATFSATITGWDYFTGVARYSATATFTGDFGEITETTGWQGYTRTASFSAILLNFKEYNATASLDTNVDTEQEKINAGFKEYSANATFSTNVGDAVAINLYASLKPVFDGFGETLTDSEGFHNGYAKLDLITTSIGLSLSDSKGLINGYASLNMKFNDIGKTLSDSEGLINGYVSLSLSGISQNSSSPTVKYGYVLYSQSAKFDYNNQRLNMSTNSSNPSILSGYALFVMNSGYSTAYSGWSSSSGNPHTIYGWSRFLFNNGLSDSYQGFRETTSNSPNYLNSYGWARFLFNNGISQTSQGFKLTSTSAASWHTLYGWTYFVLNSGYSSSSIGFNTTTSTLPSWYTRYGWTKFLFNNGWSIDTQGFSTNKNSPKEYKGYATFDASPFVSEFDKAKISIQSSIDNFSLSSTNVVSEINSLAFEINAAVSGFSVDASTPIGQVMSGGNTNAALGSATYYSTLYSGQTKYYYTSELQTSASREDQYATLAKRLKDEQSLTDRYVVTASTGYRSYVFDFHDEESARMYYDSYVRGGFETQKYGFQQGGLVPGPMDTIPAMLAPGEYIMSRGAVDALGIGTLNSLNAGDLSALRQTGDPEVRRLLRELIVAVQTSDTEVNVYTDTKGETKAAINEFRTELRERSRRQGEKYVNVRYV